MTVHYEFKLERQTRSLFQVKIGLAGLTVKIQEEGHVVEFQGPDHGV